MAANNIVVILDKWDAKYMYCMREYLKGSSLKVITHEVGLLTQVKNYCKSHISTKVITTSLPLLRKLVAQHDPNILPKDINLQNYRGSMFYIGAIQVLILPSPKILNFVPIAPWLFKRWISKLTNPNFPVFPKMDWLELRPETIDAFLERAKDAILIGVDIETARRLVDPAMVEGDPEEYRGIWTTQKKGKSGKASKIYIPTIPLITMVGYCCIFRAEDGSFYSETGVLRINSMVDIYYMRQFNLLDPPKVLQNGGYDCTYFLRYQAPMKNYLYDTFVGMHSWLVELPRNLSFITSLFDRDHIYWKDEADSNLAEYNAKDCHNTAWSWLYMVFYWPEYAANNYLINFRNQFPCIHAGLEGFAVDEPEVARLKLEREDKVAAAEKRIEKLVVEGFNPGSSKQVLKLLHGVGFKRAKDTTDATMQDFIDSHPLYDVLGTLIQDIKKDRKAISTYFKVILINGRYLYELNPSGTDTGRLASKGSNLWCGNNVQNQPLYTKSMYLADSGYDLNAADYAQSESRCTAYISEDATLLFNVEDTSIRDGKPIDFHQTNGAAFFGVPPKEIVGSKPGDLRWSSKKVNHGANYNMGWRVLLQVMSRKAVNKAARLMGLSRSWNVQKICNYLLDQFDKTYPDVRGKYYTEVIEEIQKTGFLVGATGWVRRCFGDPMKNKPTLNSYIAHPPQSLSVMKINEAYFGVWLQLQIEEEIIRLKPQVHDEIMWQCAPKDTEYTVKVVEKYMGVGTEVNGRMMVIPVDVSTGGKCWLDLKD